MDMGTSFSDLLFSYRTFCSHFAQFFIIIQTELIATIVSDILFSFTFLCPWDIK